MLYSSFPAQMSGFSTVLNLDQSPADEPLARRMESCLATWGADAQQTRIIGPLAMSHVHLALAQGALVDQPFSLDGNSWIVADARIDGRQELAAELGRARPGEQKALSDVE